MTNKEVINFLDQVRKILLDDKSWLESTIQPINEAFDMAISALQAQDVPDANVSDMISRKAAIDALLEEVRLVDGYYVENDEVIDKDDAIEAIRLLPFAQPEQPEDICGECDAWNKYKLEHKTGRWIPVSERMPEDGENCLVSVRCSNNFLVDMGTYSTDLFKVDEEHFFGKRGESGWYYLSSEYGYCKILNVIAWMPEPRPYKEIKDEGFN